jgi:hypothetical protein
MKPYAIITLHDLKVRTFTDKDEWKTAIGALTKVGFQFIALKWHHGAGVYQLPEVVTRN